MDKLPKSYYQFEKKYAKVFLAYEALGKAASESGPLDTKARELVKLGMAAAIGSQGGVQSHTHRALDKGATPDEVEHAVILGVTTIGFPSMIKVLNWVQSAIKHNKK